MKLVSYNLVASFRCVLLRHDWKRAVRQGFSTLTGKQSCRRCGKTRLVTLRQSRKVRVAETVERVGAP